MYHAAEPRDFLTVLADSMCTLGNVQMYVMGSTLVVLGPEHARMLNQNGWNKRDIRSFLFEHARKPVSPASAAAGLPRETPAWTSSGPSSSTRPTTPSGSRWCAAPRTSTSWWPAAPAAPHSAYIPGWGSRLVIKKIQLP